MFFVFAWKMTESITINFLQLINAAPLYSFIEWSWLNYNEK